MGLSEVGRDPGILGFSTGKATGAPDNGLITDSLEPTPGERPNPWAQLAISLHSAHNVSEPIGSFSISGSETAMLACGAFEAAGRNPAVASSVWIRRHQSRRRYRHHAGHHLHRHPVGRSLWLLGIRRQT